ncbi:MAG: hydrogenase subunit MbhD domain-containing protein, partial [Woeseia sp.]
MIILFGVFLLTLLVITALAIVRSESLFAAVILTGIFSLLMAANFFLLDAADVALTEAAIGAGISTVLFLGALALTGESERGGSNNRLLALGVVTVTTLIVIYATFDKPRLGDPEAPVHQHVGPWYLEKTPEL